MEELDNKDHHLFKWGKKKGTNINKDTQFYNSFLVDGVHYSLFDNVYLFRDGDVTPCIGKILKLWEKDDGGKKVKILWFFFPSEISNYMGDYKPLENELFLASGDGRGLTNINDLGAISGKCSVICTSEDRRNPQPSKNELEKSDFIFSRAFDVGNLVISDVFPDEIAQVKVEFLLNKKDDRGLSEKAEGGTSKKSLRPEAKTSDENKEANGVLKNPASNVESSRGREDDDIKSVAQCVPEKVTSAKHKAETVLCNDKPTATQSVNEKVPSAKRKEEPDLCSDIKSAKHKAETVLCNDKPTATQPVDEKVPSAKRKEEPDLCSDIKSSKRKAETILSNDKPTATQSVDEKIPSVKRKEEPDLCSYKPSKKLKISTPAESQIIEVTKKPDNERNKWFKGPSWEERIPKAHDKGTLMLLQYFDQSLTSATIEDIIYSAFNHSCSARVLPVIPSYRNPHYGQAYVTFKTPEATSDAIKKINTGCLLLPDGSSFFASKGMLQVPPKETKFPGHLTVDSKKAYREEMRNAVSTAHCSQPNTIEYEMAMEWILLQEKTAVCFEKLHKKHGEEMKKLKRNLKPIE